VSRSVLFVCLGNICRSPLAEAALRQECARAGLNIRIDSAGTGDWHVGQPPDERAQAAAARHGVDIGDLRGRQVSVADFHDFDHIIALDNQNLRDLTTMRPAGSDATLSLLCDHVADRTGDDVADPYHGRDDDFDQTWAEVTVAAAAIRKWLEAT